MVAYANGCVRHFMRHVLHDRHGDLRREPANRGCTVGPLGLGFNRLSVLWSTNISNTLSLASPMAKRAARPRMIPNLGNPQPFREIAVPELCDVPALIPVHPVQ